MFFRYSWYYPDTWCGNIYSPFIEDIGFSVAFFAAILWFNILTLLALRTNNNKVARLFYFYTKNMYFYATGIHDNEMNARRATEIRFFIQALANALIFDISIFCFNVISRFTTTKWGWYWTTIIPWLVAHASNGYNVQSYNLTFKLSTQR